jgi:hypothetical protein
MRTQSKIARRMPMKNVLLSAAALLALAGGAVYAQHDQKAPARGDNASERVLKSMRNEFHAKVGRLSGIATTGDVEQTTLGPLLITYEVAVPALQAYDGKSSAEALWSPSPRATRLIMVNGVAQSCIGLTTVNGEWETSTIGAANRAASIDAITRDLAAHGVDAKGLFLVEIPSMSLEFLAYRTNGSVMLARLGYGPGPQWLSAGQPVPAESAFASLVESARAMGDFSTL